MAQSATRLIVQAGDRPDLISFRAYGQASKFESIIMANPRLDPLRPKAGTEVTIPRG